jgi:hypothetical protein
MSSSSKIRKCKIYLFIGKYFIHLDAARRHEIDINDITLKYYRRWRWGSENRFYTISFAYIYINI